MTFLNCACGKRRSTRTMMVLAILLARTSPIRSLRLPRDAVGVAVVVSDITKSGCLLLVAQGGYLGLDSCNVPAQVAQARRLLQLPAGLLQAQVKHLLAQVPAFGRQLH